MLSTPQLTNRGQFRPVFQRPDRPEIPGEFPGIWGKKSQPHSLDRRAEWSFLEPIWERPAGPKLTRAEQVES